MMTAMGQEWNVAILGPKDADRTMLLCNGIGASVETIGPFVDHFKRTRLVAFDVPGVGESPTPFSPYRFSNLTRMLNIILDDLGIGMVDVFGVSWGGALAQQFAYDFQERCYSLTLAATAAGLVIPSFACHLRPRDEERGTRKRIKHPFPTCSSEGKRDSLPSQLHKRREVKVRRGGKKKRDEGRS